MRSAVDGAGATVSTCVRLFDHNSGGLRQEHPRRRACGLGLSASTSTGSRSLKQQRRRGFGRSELVRPLLKLGDLGLDGPTFPRFRAFVLLSPRQRRV